MDSHPLVLGLRSAGLQGVDPSNVNEMHDIWNAFSKARNCIDGGYRYEYLSWRIYSRELLRLKNFTSPVVVSPDELDPMTEISYKESSDSDSNTDSDYLSDPMVDSCSSFYGSPTNNSTKATCSTNSGNSGGDTSKQMNPKKGQSTTSDSTSCLTLNSIHSMRRISSIELEHMFKVPPVRDEFSEKANSSLKNTTHLSQCIDKKNEHVGVAEESVEDAKTVTNTRKPTSESKRTHSKIGFDTVHTDRANAIYLRRSRFNRSRPRFQNVSRESKRFSVIKHPDTVKKSNKSSSAHRFLSAQSDGEFNQRDINQAGVNQIEVKGGDPLDAYSQVSANSTSRRGSLEEPINSGNAQKESLPIIRGFDTSQISVCVNRRSVPDIKDELESAHVLHEETENSELENGSTAIVRQSSAQYSNNSVSSRLHDEKQPRHNMFFIGAAESDSEVSPLNSPTSNNVEISSGSRDFLRMDKKSSGTIREEEWDDISVDEGDESVDEVDQSEENEEHLRSLFTERDVPTSPGLKRSLLSSLFLSKMEQSSGKKLSALYDTDHDSRVSEDSLKMNSVNAKCSVDNSPNRGSPSFLHDGNYIDMIPKFRMRASPQTVASISTTQWQGGRSTCKDHEKHKINHKLRQPLTRACSQSSGLDVSQSKSPIGSQTNITARPEIFRASSTTRVDALSNLESTSKMDWSNLHEDIYDPMNYHSRGW